MASARHGRANMQHESTSIGEHLGHDSESLFLAGVIAFTLLLVLRAGLRLPHATKPC
jgi:hypothetical protein